MPAHLACAVRQQWCRISIRWLCAFSPCVSKIWLFDIKVSCALTVYHLLFFGVIFARLTVLTAPDGMIGIDILIICHGHDGMPGLRCFMMPILPCSGDAWWPAAVTFIIFSNVDYLLSIICVIWCLVHRYFGVARRVICSISGSKANLCLCLAAHSRQCVIICFQVDLSIPWRASYSSDTEYALRSRIIVFHHQP